VLVTTRTPQWRADRESRQHKGDAARNIYQIGQPVEGCTTVIHVTVYMTLPCLCQEQKLRNQEDKASLETSQHQRQASARMSQEHQSKPQGCDRIRAREGEGSESQGPFEAGHTFPAAMHAARCPLPVSNCPYCQKI
jgi:hypothetical protein